MVNARGFPSAPSSVDPGCVLAHAGKGLRGCPVRQAKAPIVLLQFIAHQIPSKAIQGLSMKKTGRARMMVLFAFLSGFVWTVERSVAQTATAYPSDPSEKPAQLKPPTEDFDYLRREVMIPVRDGVRLHTIIPRAEGRKSCAHTSDANSVQCRCPDKPRRERSPGSHPEWL
jgi:hypothetical protein